MPCHSVISINSLAYKSAWASFSHVELGTPCHLHYLAWIHTMFKREKTFITLAGTIMLIGSLFQLCFVRQCLLTNQDISVLFASSVSIKLWLTIVPIYQKTIQQKTISQKALSARCIKYNKFTFSSDLLHNKIHIKKFLFVVIYLIHFQQCQVCCNNTFKPVPVMSVILGLLDSVGGVSRSKSNPFTPTSVDLASYCSENWVLQKPQLPGGLHGTWTP